MTERGEAGSFPKQAAVSDDAVAAPSLEAKLAGEPKQAARRHAVRPAAAYSGAANQVTVQERSAVQESSDGMQTGKAAGAPDGSGNWEKDARDAAARRKLERALRAASADEHETMQRAQTSTSAMVPARVIAHAAELRKRMPMGDAGGEVGNAAGGSESLYIDTIEIAASVETDGAEASAGGSESLYIDTIEIAASDEVDRADASAGSSDVDLESGVGRPRHADREVTMGRKLTDLSASERLIKPAATLDLALLANVERGDQVRVEHVTDKTQALFDETLKIVGREVGAGDEGHSEDPTLERHGACFVPQNRDLRALFHLAEAVGGYETFHELNSKHAPINLLSSRYAEQARQGRLSDKELGVLRALQASVREAIKNAGLYLRNVAVNELSYAEICELHDTILEARKKAAKLDEVLGLHFMHEVEWAVERLHEFRLKINNVERSVSGIFFVNSEVMFVPTNELIKCVNVLFEAVGNAYLARHINGVLLLAARNLLIEVASFHSYYGKEQIYHLFRRSGSTINAHVISMRVRREIRRLFEACQRDNKLVLTRVMRDAERKFEVSVEAIQSEAESIAVDAVARLAPPADLAKGPAPRRSLLRKMVAWMIGGRSSTVGS